MRITLPLLPDRVAEALVVPPLDLRHRVKHARRDGEFRGVQGQADAEAETEDAARLVIACQRDVPQTLAGQAIREIGSLLALQPLYYATYRRDGFEGRCVFAARGTPFLDVLCRLIDGHRHGATSPHACQFPEIRVASSGGETWAEILTSHVVDEARASQWLEQYLSGSPPNYGLLGLPLRVVFAHEPARRPRRASELPRWACRSPLVRATSVTSSGLIAIARLLGPLEERPTWPKFERVQLEGGSKEDDGRPTEASRPSSPVSPGIHPRANAGVVVPSANSMAPNTQTQESGSTHGLDDRERSPECPVPPPRKRRTA